MSVVTTLLRSAATRAPGKVALAVPSQGISWSFAELHERVAHLAEHLRGGGSDYLLAHGYNRWNDHGAGRAPRCVMRLDNSAENVLTQLACAEAGVSVSTVKTAAAMADELVALTVIHAAASAEDLSAPELHANTTLNTHHINIHVSPAGVARIHPFGYSY